jgi:hypothetical protein
MLQKLVQRHRRAPRTMMMMMSAMPRMVRLSIYEVRSSLPAGSLALRGLHSIS